MEDFYNNGHKLLQKKHNSERIATQLYDTRLHSTFTEDDKSIIDSSLFFFIASSDDKGNCDCSYKGGNIGFVKIVSESKLVFANYDGNGMYRSLGNIHLNPKIGLLFIQFEKDKRRIRVNGHAELSYDQKLLADFPGAESIILVTATHIFPNCPRNIHTMEMKKTSIYSPNHGYSPPEPFWKSKPDLKDYLD